MLLTPSPRADGYSRRTGQRFHIDVTVDDVEVAEREVLALGATKASTDLQFGMDDNWLVFLDPAGHPFCLCWD